MSGMGNVGDGLFLLKCGGAIQRIQEFRLHDGHFVTLGEGEHPLCLGPRGSENGRFGGVWLCGRPTGVRYRHGRPETGSSPYQR